MQRAIIYVFSGTKNTLLTANMVKESLDLRNVQTTIYEIKKPFVGYPLPGDFDFVGFAYPVHAFNSPQFFLRFVKQLPDTSRKAFIIKTSGEPFKPNDTSSYKLCKILKSKSFDVVLERHLLMPYNVMFRYEDSLAKQMVVTNKALCELTAKQLLSGIKLECDYPLRYRLLSAALRIQWPGAIINGRVYTVNKKKCTMCMRCVNECPTKNITHEKDKLCFDSACAMCMRCVMFCPTDAIYPGILRFWRVNGAYNFNRILSNPAISADYVNEKTKGYFRLFHKYYRNVQKELTEYGQSITRRSEDSEDALSDLIEALDLHIEEDETELIKEKC